MQPNPVIVLGYGEYGEIQLEVDVLRTLDAQIITTNLSDPANYQLLSSADALMVTIQPVTAEHIAHLSRCRIISRVGTGIDSIDLAAAAQKGIWVTNVPDYGVDEVSTHAIALLLAHVRKLPVMLESVRQQQWSFAHAKPIQRLSLQTIGVVGFGRIAQAVAHKAQALGLRVLTYDPYIDARKAEALQVQSVSLETLLHESDFISLHCPLTPENRHIINRTTLAQMKPTAFLINTARGPLINEGALAEAITQGQIAGAALDVLTHEPPEPGNPLVGLDKVWITPHAAWYSEQSAVDMRVRGAEEVVRVLRGDPPRSPVNQPVQPLTAALE